jgi:hypothetical protein
MATRILIMSIAKFRWSSDVWRIASARIAGGVDGVVGRPPAPEADLSWPGQLWPMITILRIISRAHVAPALLLIRKG